MGVRNYNNDHYDKDLNRDLLSIVRFNSKFHLIRLFKRHFGQMHGKGHDPAQKRKHG